MDILQSPSIKLTFQPQICTILRILCLLFRSRIYLLQFRMFHGLVWAGSFLHRHGDRRSVIHSIIKWRRYKLSRSKHTYSGCFHSHRDSTFNLDDNSWLGWCFFKLNIEPHNRLSQSQNSNRTYCRWCGWRYHCYRRRCIPDMVLYAQAKQGQGQSRRARCSSSATTSKCRLFWCFSKQPRRL